MHHQNIAPQDAAQVDMRDKSLAGNGLPAFGTCDEMRAFLTDVFGGLNPEQVWTCAFANPPGNWTGGFGVRRLERLPPDRANFYFCIGEMDPGAVRRSSDGVVRQHMVVADDVGTKASFAAWDAMFAAGFPEPTFRIETSPGNQTWGWVLDEPVERSDVAEWVALGLLRAWMGERGLTDPGVADAARYIRLPLGWNSKPKYVPEGGEPPAVRLVEWVKGRRVTLDAMGEALLGAGWRMQPVPASLMNPSLLPTSGAGALVRTADMNRPEPIIRLAQELGLGPKQVRPGVVEAICPNVGEHTADGREETGFSFLGGGLMHCTHGHCQHLRTPDFKAMMVERYNDQVAVRLALGQEVDPRVQDGDGFLLQASLEYHGALSDADEVLIEAERMAVVAHSAARAKQAGVAAQNAAALSAKAIRPVQTFVPGLIPPRQWVYGRVYMRGVYSLLVASGGSGKSALTMVDTLAIATGRELIPGQRVVGGPKTVWYHNGEDSQDEQLRRLAAAMQHYGITHADLGGRLILTSGHDHPIKLGGMGPNGPELTPGAGEWIVETAHSLGVDVLILDPLGAVHGLPENSNEAMNLLAGGLSRIAIDANIAIGLVHHVSQAAAGNMRASGANAARGATALVDRSRNTRQISRPDEKEAPSMGIKSDERWRYLAISNGKANNARLADAHWVKLVSVSLGNGTPDYPAGDEVQTVESWTPPKGVVGAPSDLARLQDAIRTRPVLPRYAAQAPDWVGYILADVLGLDAGRGSTLAQCSAAQIDARARVKAMIQTWIASGGLEVETRPDPKGKQGATIAYVKPGLPAAIADNPEAEADADASSDPDGPEE